MVWGMISSAGVGRIFRFHGYINVPCHKAITVLSFLEEGGIAVMKWPPQSPDMNPVKNVWKIIEEKAQNRNPQNIDGLWGFLKEE